MELSIILTRLALTFFFALLFGIQRQRASKLVGFGTFIFVSTGSCVLAIISVTLHSEDPLPLLGAIITGIGFLGAGALIKTTDKVFGFTSASSIWLFAILGLVIGVGEYILGTIIYISVWIALFIDKYLEVKGIGSYQKKIIIGTNRILPVDDIFEDVSHYTDKIRKVKLISLEVNNQAHTMLLSYNLEGDKDTINKLVSLLFKEKWVASCKVE